MTTVTRAGLAEGGRYATEDGLEFVVLEVHDDGAVYVESGPDADYITAGWLNEPADTEYTLIGEETPSGPS